MSLSFLMPCRIESPDRLRNVISSVGYLAKNFPDCKIIIQEVDKKSVFRDQVIPNLTTLFGKYPENIVHRFEESQEPFFHKTRILNDLLLAADTEIVFNYDVDVVYPLSSYSTAYNMITQGGYDAVYTFGCGIYQWAVQYNEATFHNFLKSGFDTSVLDSNSRLSPSVMGWGQMIKRRVQIDAGLWNENFISWGAEDCEFHYRIPALGYKVGRINDFVYHLDHSRTFNSHYNNPKFMDNHNLWQSIRTWDKETLVKYYSQQDYLKARREQLNASL